ncbi:MAG: hypothetical protein WBI95_09835 [Pseudomonas veronii]|uniref:hypothetical protein n=1 Tax=Pseudomonas veronii TaxID=76761 RepID=UPI003C724CB8
MSEVKPDKPCPFCGNPTVQTTVDDGYHWTSCPKCAATGPTEFLRSDEDSPGWNTRPDFDRVTAERDALQQRLTAADERADVLETALKKISVRCVAYIEAEREMPEPSVEVCQMIASAALKPAEAQLNQCDGCQAGIPAVNGAHRMGKPGGYPDTMSCTAKLYKP